MARPTKLPPELEKGFWELVGKHASRRTMRNAYFTIRALNILNEDGIEKYSFLYEVKADGREKIRRTLLTELGRIADEEVLLRDAKYICDGKPNTVDTLDYLRMTRKYHGSYDEVYNHAQIKN